MSNIYFGQAFDIETTVDDDLTGATNVRLNSIRDNSVPMPQLVPTVPDAANGKIVYVVENNEFPIGSYSVWPTYTDGNNKPQIGAPFILEVLKPGTIKK
jgi:hypothetical protein